MAQYDPAILVKFADKLYLRAASLVAVYSLLGLLLGGGAGLVFSSLSSRSGADMTTGFVCAVIGLALGAYFGWEKAFWIKVEAQRVLCLAKIEENCRPQSGRSPGAQHAQEPVHQKI